MTQEFITKTIAHMLVITGPGTEVADEIVTDRSEETIAKLQEQFDNGIAEIVFCDIIETKINDLNFASEPTNQKHVVILEPKDVEARLEEAKQKIMDMIGGVIEQLQHAVEEDQVQEHHHTLH